MSAVEQFRTLNSTYELDRDAKRIRRVTGAFEPTSNQGSDGEWQSYEAVLMQPSGCLLIVFGQGRGTLTSRVVEGWNEVQS